MQRKEGCFSRGEVRMFTNVGADWINPLVVVSRRRT
jgi:hypothetical protein